MNEELEVDDIMVAEYDLSDYDEDIEEQDQVLTQLERTMKRSFDLNDGFLFKACLVNLGQRGMYLYLISHKMIMDMPSWKIVVEELVQSLDEILNDKESNSIKGEKEKW